METSRILLRPAVGPSTVEIMFLVDGVSQEGDESLTLQLMPTVSTLLTIPIGEAVFFKNTMTLTISDDDSK